MRMNISVPDELAERVRTLDLPISSICQSALKNAADAAEKRAELADDDLAKVAARLRGTVDAKYVEIRLGGYEDGKRWAKGWASLDELKDFAEKDVPPVIEAPHSLTDFVGDKHNALVTSVRIAAEDDGYWLGFYEGVRDIWKAVEPLI